MRIQADVVWVSARQRASVVMRGCGRTLGEEKEVGEDGELHDEVLGLLDASRASLDRMKATLRAEVQAGRSLPKGALKTLKTGGALCATAVSPGFEPDWSVPAGCVAKNTLKR